MELDSIIISILFIYPLPLFMTGKNLYNLFTKDKKNFITPMIQTIIIGGLFYLILLNKCFESIEL